VNLLHPLAGSNWTNVVFSIVAYTQNLTISSTWLSLLRALFYVLGCAPVNAPLDRVPRGITIIPLQSAFIPQAHRASFNFTLNFPIYKVQDITDELKDQMKTRLLLNSNEAFCTFRKLMGFGAFILILVSLFFLTISHWFVISGF